MEIFKIEEMGTKDLSINEIVKLVTDNYRKSEQTCLNWYNPDAPGMVEIFFLDGNNRAFESLLIKKSDYKKIIKPAILAINN